MTLPPEPPDEPDQPGEQPGEPDRPGEEPPGPGDQPGGGLDEDAAWRSIVEHYGDRPVVDSPSPEQVRRERDERLRGLFRPAWDDASDSGPGADDDEHFVPPEPEPIPVLDPRRRAAWAGLFGSPLVMLVAVVLGWHLPAWSMLLLVAGFVGGFVYLVATMTGDRPGPGDDGAVV